MNSSVYKAYDPEEFRTLGHELIDLLADYLQQNISGDKKVISWKEPSDQLAFWQENLHKDQHLTDFFRNVLENSISIHNPRYIGHQVGATQPVSALADLLGALTNNGMAVYEMGAAGSAIEKIVSDLIARQLGFGAEADGYMTSGGTLANLTALLAARRAKAGIDVWQEGHVQKLGVMVSAEAHYCVDRSLRIMGFGSEGIIKIPVTADFKMDVSLLAKYLQDARNKGIQVIAVAASAPSTATGMYDDLVSIASFCRNHNLWFHVDAAHGGAVVFSDKYKHLAEGIQQADSVVIDAHKMMMAPVLTTFLVFRNKLHSYSNFSQNAQYLWEKEDAGEWYNYAKRTFECTKLMMSVKFYAILKSFGPGIFDEYVTRQYELGKVLAAKIRNRAQFELLLEPDSNIVCFRIFQPGLSEGHLNQLNTYIRKSLLESGEFYIVQTQLKQSIWLRATIMSPFTEPHHLDELLDKIEQLSESFHP